MTSWTRRSFIVAAAATAGCSQARVTSTREEIDAQVAQALDVMYATVPGSREVADQAAGILVMPNITEAGLFFGGSYGEGALLIGGAPVDYYSVAGASFGLQIGAQRVSQALFFMTPDSLFQFRTTDGWELGAEAEYTASSSAGSAGLDTTTVNKPVFALIFNQRGLIAAATLEGAKYSRIIR